MLVHQLLVICTIVAVLLLPSPAYAGALQKGDQLHYVSVATEKDGTTRRRNATITFHSKTMQVHSNGERTFKVLRDETSLGVTHRDGWTIEPHGDAPSDGYGHISVGQRWVTAYKSRKGSLGRWIEDTRTCEVTKQSEIKREAGSFNGAFLLECKTVAGRHPNGTKKEPWRTASHWIKPDENGFPLRLKGSTWRRKWNRTTHYQLMALESSSFPSKK